MKEREKKFTTHLEHGNGFRIESPKMFFSSVFRDEEKHTMMEDHCSERMTDYAIHLMKEEEEEESKCGERRRK